ncbi:uncharacterized protein FOMMEDRAFT_151710 [Fomitiporia mediterranea MF3/22]|uniref:uncharacterized protein n=1 Tax=Fomitiporia mediterranea (strain MF3/22) TaxID=694068 RepID=UPI00044085C4|nr:uncharacterized protein FOMMEDRAFT_151710 [Fomitiporia mediterranea MF3/22]EJD06442.1 hypothetical protein FOMMEDRAFT_151710 [Fomitiporia mediterranea MF3/22]
MSLPDKIGVLNGLSYLHDETRHVHRNITPNNILIMSTPDQPVRWREVKITDLMFVRGIEHGDYEKVDEVDGALSFRAPEVFHGIRCFAQDIWAFG